MRAHRLLRGQAGLRTPLSLRLAVVIRSVQKADLAVAARHLRHATAPVAIGADPGLTAACALWRATVLAQSGRPRDAQAILETSASARPPLPLLEVHRDVILSGIEARLGRPEAALRRLEPHRDGRFAALADVACAHAYLALDDTDSARESIRRVLTSASNQPGRDVLVEAMLLGARIAEREHDTRRALDMITNALDMAQTELVLPFVQAREAFAGLLARHPGVVSRWPAPPAGVQGSEAAAQGHGAPSSGQSHAPGTVRPRLPGHEHDSGGDRRGAVLVGQHGQDAPGRDLPQAERRRAPGSGAPGARTGAAVSVTGR
jgi:MalT-like TPR region